MEPSYAGQPIPERPKKDVAVYIDYENLYISLRSTVNQNPAFDAILDKCREFGRVTIARAYADWSEFARVVTSQMFSSGLEPIYVPTRKFYDAKTRSQATKNSVDIHITIDIIKDVLTSKNIDVFVLVSGDRDFVPLMNQIRAAGKEVYAIGVAGCTSSELAVAVDEMFYYHQLFENEEELEAEQRDVYLKLVRAIEIARARGYRTTLGLIKPIMREVVSSFDERNFRNSKGVPFQKFGQFAREAERLGFIRVVDTGGGALELFLVSEDPKTKAAGRGDDDASSRASRSDDDDSPTSRRRGRRGGRRRRGRGVAAADNGEAVDVSEDDADEAAEQEVRVLEVDTELAREADEAPPPAATDAPAEEAEETEAEEKPARRRRAPSRRKRTTTRKKAVEAEAADEDAEPAAEAEAEEPAETPAEEVAEPAPVEEVAAVTDSETDDDLTLPTEAFDDLKAMLETFGGRAPSQRRLIARLKERAKSGELNGEYREGQFLLMVSKALEEGKIERVSKGFYSGLRWVETDAAAAT